MLIKCSKCGEMVSDSSRYCQNCGNPLRKNNNRNNVRYCPGCSKPFLKKENTNSDLNMRYCSNCGYDLKKEEDIKEPNEKKEAINKAKEGINTEKAKEAINKAKEGINTEKAKEAINKAKESINTDKTKDSNESNLKIHENKKIKVILGILVVLLGIGIFSTFIKGNVFTKVVEAENREEIMTILRKNSEYVKEYNSDEYNNELLYTGEIYDLKIGDADKPIEELRYGIYNKNGAVNAMAYVIEDVSYKDRIIKAIDKKFTPNYDIYNRLSYVDLGYGRIIKAWQTKDEIRIYLIGDSYNLGIVYCIGPDAENEIGEY